VHRRHLVDVAMKSSAGGVDRQWLQGAAGRDAGMGRRLAGRLWRRPLRGP
jgi:hypothetical protein